MLILQAIRAFLSLFLLGMCIGIVINYFIASSANNTDIMIALIVLIGTAHTLITNMEADDEVH